MGVCGSPLKITCYSESFPVECVELCGYFSERAPQVGCLEHRYTIFLAQATELAEEGVVSRAVQLEFMLLTSALRMQAGL